MTNKLHKEALEQFDDTYNFDKECRELAQKARLFVDGEGSQWEDDKVTKRKDRPRYTIDRISGALDQVRGNQRQTRMGIKVIPKKEGTEQLANIYTGLIRHIEDQSSADDIYDAASDEQVKGGYGGWRIVTEWEEDGFNQTIKIKWIPSADSTLFFDPNAREYTREDSKFAFLITWMTHRAYKEIWPKAPIANFTENHIAVGTARGWFSDDTVRVAEYWRKVPTTRKIGLLNDGRVIDLNEEEPVLDELAMRGLTVVREREVETYKIQRGIMNGLDFITDFEDWPSKYIPLIPLFGHNSIINNRQYIRGMVLKSQDAQRIYNYATSAAIEATALTPKDPIWITPAQQEGFEPEYRNFPIANTPFLRYNPDPNAPNPPARGGAPSLQAPLLQQISQAGTDIHATTGIEPASLGNVPELKSGKAIMAQQAMGDRGSYIYTDNLKKSKKHTAKILIDLLPRIMDTERVETIIGSDNKPETITLNETVMDQETGEPVLVNDLSRGQYDVKIVTGPPHETRRRETAEQLTELAQGSEQLQKLALDLIVDNLDLNQGEELTKRVRKDMIQQGIVEPTEEEKQELGLDQPAPPDPMQTALLENLQAQTEQIVTNNARLAADIRNKDADTQKKILEAQKQTIDSFVKLRESLLEKLEQGIPITSEDLDLIQAQAAIVGEEQLDILNQNELAKQPGGSGLPMGLPAAPGIV